MTDIYLQATIEEAQKAMTEGGVQIGSVLVLDGKIAGRAHNRQKQMNSIIRYAEIDCIDNAVGLTNADFCRTVIYTSPSPVKCARAPSYSSRYLKWSSPKTRITTVQKNTCALKGLTW